MSTPADRLRAALPPGDLNEFRLDPLDRTGVPVVSATWWPVRGTACHGIGYGHDEEAAAASAWGECVENAGATLAAPRWERVRGSFAELRAQHGAAAVLDPRAACLAAGSWWTPGSPLTWVWARRLGDGRPVLVPIELAASHPAHLEPEDRSPEGCLALPITNGLGAGADRAAAIDHAVRELLQRDGNAVAYRAFDRGVAVQLDKIADPRTRALLDRLDAAGIDVLVKLASTEHGVANLYVVGRDRDPEDAPHPLTLTACGEAAHPDREVALGKALREFCASRVRKPFMHGPDELVERVADDAYLRRSTPCAAEDEERRTLDAMVGWLDLDAGELLDLIADPVLAVRETVRFSTLPRGGVIDLAGMDVLVLDLLKTETATAVKVIVPGLEVETATYHRIGARGVTRLADRGLAGFGPPPPATAPVLLPPDGDRQAWLDTRTLDEIVDPYYPLYREPGRRAAPHARMARRS